VDQETGENDAYFLACFLSCFCVIAPSVHICTIQFEVGRHVPNTGVWSCCGDAVKLSMYCESFQERVDYKDGLRRVAEEAVEEVEKSSKRRADLLGQIKAAENQSEPLPATLTREERAIEEACREVLILISILTLILTSILISILILILLPILIPILISFLILRREASTPPCWSPGCSGS
jgi:hypothetical protein